MIVTNTIRRAYKNCASDARWERRHPNKKPEQREHRNHGKDFTTDKFRSGSPTWNKKVRFMILST